MVLEWNWMATTFSSGTLDDHCSFSGCLISNHSKQIVIALNRLEKSLREEKLFNVIHTDYINVNDIEKSLLPQDCFKAVQGEHYFFGGCFE